MHSQKIYRMSRKYKSKVVCQDWYTFYQNLLTFYFFLNDEPDMSKYINIILLFLCDGCTNMTHFLLSSVYNNWLRPKAEYSTLAIFNHTSLPTFWYKVDQDAKVLTWKKNKFLITTLTWLEKLISF